MERIYMGTSICGRRPAKSYQLTGGTVAGISKCCAGIKSLGMQLCDGAREASCSRYAEYGYVFSWQRAKAST